MFLKFILTKFIFIQVLFKEISVLHKSVNFTYRLIEVSKDFFLQRIFLLIIFVEI